MTMLRKSILLAWSSVLGACLYDGNGTQGLPCTVDDDCGAQQCVQHVCGGPDTAAEGGGTTGTGSGSESSAETGEPITEQVLPEPCQDGHQACIGTAAMEICQDGKLTSIRCEAWCGMGNLPQGGCQADPRNGLESCWCENQGGPPSGTCESACSSSTDCSPGESCLSLTSGQKCVPSQCNGCFNDGQSCGWYLDSCQFDACG